ncbi:phage tail tube protein [Yersinia mollaretii]|uniref:phage tail tube protein n=1 Tax=Yersinia mollaretii TaxID=33060 RepID=UPI00119F5F7F|nr:phage tail tube protein [Yersinia mollaretii]
MGFALPNGAGIYLAKTYETELAVTAVSNAVDAVLTVATDHGIAEGDIVQLTSGWGALNDLAAKVTASTSTTLTLGSIDTSNTDRFAVGGGVGTVKKVASWIEIPQITEVANSGGDQQMIQIQFLSDTRQRNLNTFKAAQSQTLTLAHDSTQPVYPVLRAADETEQTLATYMYVPKAKENRYSTVKVSFNDIPTTAINAIETVAVVFNLQSQAMTFYKSGATVAVTGVTLNKTTTSLAVAATETLTATIAPSNATNKSGTWPSSAPAKATVDPVTGVVTGVATGTANIIYTTADGAKTATCAVTVTA